MSKLYRDHLVNIMSLVDKALAKAGFEHLIVAAGVEKYSFLDDRPYPFKVNPQFKWWLPLTQHPQSWIAYTPGNKPILVYYQPDDYWHLPPATPEGFWVEHFDIRIIADSADAAKHLPVKNAAIIAETDAGIAGVAPNNPKAVIDYLHYHRGYKTDYERDRMRAASRRAVKGHLAARVAFHNGGSERDIHCAYLQASGHTDLDLPYTNIIGLNEHAATLHYQYQQEEKPEQTRSFLIDAGAEIDGYAADITRTWSGGDDAFDDLIKAVDNEQQALCEMVRTGRDYREIHLETHLRLAGVLRSLDIVDMDPASMVESGVSSTFFPHGIGHLIGLQVHDVAGRHDENGIEIPRPKGHPYLRLTRKLAAGMAVTIEPGIYFIDTLLAKLRNSSNAKVVNWDNIEHFKKFGGVRIEDDVICTADKPENLTRDAFAAMQ